MNPELSKNIAKLQTDKNKSDIAKAPTIVDLTLVKAMVKRIASFKLGRKLDKYGERTGWFECSDQAALVEKLEPSADQKQFLGSMTLKLRIMTAIEEGKNARSLNLFGFDNPNAVIPAGHLFSVLALSPYEDVSDDLYRLYGGSDPSGLILPGSPEFTDLQVIIDSFSA
ncbi:MAG: hypothetical protein ABSB12_02235 [Candidatus Saccharimonadales bacterium]